MLMADALSLQGLAWLEKGIHPACLHWYLVRHHTVATALCPHEQTLPHPYALTACCTGKSKPYLESKP